MLVFDPDVLLLSRQIFLKTVLKQKCILNIDLLNNLTGLHKIELHYELLHFFRDPIICIDIKGTVKNKTLCHILKCPL
jgi:hypothetical protein